ncbi:uncharacterized protein V6R79_013003 [Siganus canaliculatus]
MPRLGDTFSRLVLFDREAESENASNSPPNQRKLDIQPNGSLSSLDLADSNHQMFDHQSRSFHYFNKRRIPSLSVTLVCKKTARVQTGNYIEQGLLAA